MTIPSPLLLSLPPEQANLLVDAALADRLSVTAALELAVREYAAKYLPVHYLPPFPTHITLFAPIPFSPLPQTTTPEKEPAQ